MPIPVASSLHMRSHGAPQLGWLVSVGSVRGELGTRGAGGRPMPVPGFIFLLGMISGLEGGGEARIEAGKGGGEDSKPALGFM